MVALMRWIVFEADLARRSGWEGTDDWVYLRIFGRGGGREFPLDAQQPDNPLSDANDFESGDRQWLFLGESDAFIRDIHDSAEVVPFPASHYVTQAELGQPADPTIHLRVADIEHVSIRKGGSRSGANDDAVTLRWAFVCAGDGEGHVRAWQFGMNSDQMIQLSNDWGLEHWLHETSPRLLTKYPPG